MAIRTRGGVGEGTTPEVGGGFRGKTMIGLVVGVVGGEGPFVVGDLGRAGGFLLESGEGGKGCQMGAWEEDMVVEGGEGAIDLHQTGTYISSSDGLKQESKRFRLLLHLP